MDGINKKNTKSPIKRAGTPRSFSPNPNSPRFSEIKKKQGNNFQPDFERGQISTQKEKIKNNRSLKFLIIRNINTLVRLRWFRRLATAGIIFGILAFIISQHDRTHLTIRPHLQYISFDETVSAQRNPREGELGFEIIAVTDEISIPIIASGERPVETYAQGTVTIVNDYSSEPQRLLPETRFISASGKIFKLGSKEIIVPGREATKPGTIPATLYADEPGPSYNIDSTDFTIPGFKEAGLEEKYNKIYASSTGSFTGGALTTEWYITDEQEAQAERELQKQLQERLSLKLEKEKTEELMLIDNTTRIHYKPITSVFSDSKETGLVTGRGTIFAAAIGEEQLKKFVTGKLLEEDREESLVMLNPDVLDMSHGGGAIDFEHQRTLNISLSGSPLFSSVIDEEAFKNSIRGLKKKDIIDFFENTHSVDRAQVIVRPFWRKSISKDIEKITLSFE